MMSYKHEIIQDSMPNAYSVSNPFSYAEPNKSLKEHVFMRVALLNNYLFLYLVYQFIIPRNTKFSAYNILLIRREL